MCCSRQFRWLACWAAVWLALRGTAEVDPVLVPIGAGWQRFGGVVPSEPPDAWTKQGFDASGWPVGESGFGWVSTVSSDYGAVSPLLSAGGVPTYFFRRELVISNVAEIRWLMWRVDSSGGWIARLNGKEFARKGFTNVVETPIAWDQPEDVPLFARGEVTWVVSAREAGLRPGTNVLTVELHGHMVGSPALVPELIANFQRIPRVANVSSNRLDVVWQQAGFAPAVVEYGPSSALGFEAQPVAWMNQELATLTNLIGGTTYHYRVRIDYPEGPARTPIRTVRSAPVAGPVTFLMLADSGVGGRPQLDVARAMRNSPGDLVLHAGDVIYPLFYPDLGNVRCLSFYGEQMRSTPFFVAWGNHDVFGGRIGFTSAFRQPTNNVPAEDHLEEETNPDSYYSFDWGDAHFVALYVPWGSPFPIDVASRQARWLDEDLAASKKPWKFLFFHVPVRTSGPHRYDRYANRFRPDSEEIRAVVMPIAQRHGVQLILNGHDHEWERFVPDGGVHSLVSGGGGGSKYYLTERDELTSQFLVRNHFTRVMIDGDQASVQAVGTDGSIFDVFNIRRTPADPRLYSAQWRTPDIATNKPSNFDGNHFGQTWTLSSEAIQSSSGHLANAGQIRVAADHTHLYVGMERVMLPPAADIYLFVEIPGMEGIQGLPSLLPPAPVIDPSIPGAFLTLPPLAFTNFRPSIVAVLGDEFADRTAPEFQRPGSPRPMGQGVFLLKPGFPPLPGADIQQFNRSPEVAAVQDEQNADFITLAMPREVLGNLSYDGQIRVAAIVGGRLETNSPVRPIDTGFIGTQLVGGWLRPTVLEGLRVQLPGNQDPDLDGIPTAEEIRLGLNPNQRDSDQDGLNDDWELANRLDPRDSTARNGGAGDPDGDGLNNLEEQSMGTNPLSAISAFRIRGELTPDGSLRVSFPAVLGREFEVWAGSHTNATLQRLEGFTRLPGGDPRTVRIVVPGEIRSRFVQVRLVPRK